MPCEAHSPLQSHSEIIECAHKPLYLQCINRRKGAVERLRDAFIDQSGAIAATES